MKDATHVRCERRVPQPAVEPRPWAQRGARSALTASQGANGADAAQGQASAGLFIWMQLWSGCQWC